MSSRTWRSPGQRRLRLRGFDYSTAATYFVTLVTARRAPILCDVLDDRVDLSATGHLVVQCWLRSEEVIPGVGLGPFVVMPDHFHALIELRASESGNRRSLGSVIGGFKAAVTRAAGMKPGTLWQRQFHDRIIRSEAELDRCEEYIALNPERWRNGTDHDWLRAIRGQHPISPPLP